MSVASVIAYSPLRMASTSIRPVRIRYMYTVHLVGTRGIRNAVRNLAMSVSKAKLTILSTIQARVTIATTEGEQHPNYAEDTMGN